MRRFWAVAACWCLLSCKKSPPATEIVMMGKPGDPSQVLEAFQMQDYHNGKKHMTLKAKEGRIRDTEQLADLELPEVTFYKESAVSSEMNAPKGQVHMETHEVRAWGGVTVVTPDSATLITPSLRYDPKLQKIVSTDTVRLEKPDSITEGQGFQADTDLKRIKFGRQTVRLKKGLNAAR